MKPLTNVKIVIKALTIFQTSKSIRLFILVKNLTDVKPVIKASPKPQPSSAISQLILMENLKDVKFVIKNFTQVSNLHRHKPVHNREKYP